MRATVKIPEVTKLGEYWLEPRFMKDIFHWRPSLPRYTKTWDVDNELTCLKSLGPNGTPCLKQLTLKTAALLTILAGRRIHILHMLCNVHMDSPKIFYVIGMEKWSKPSKLNQPVVYRTYVKDEPLCPVKCIWPYLSQRSKSATQEFTEFFITYDKPQHLAYKDSFAH